MKTLCLRLFAAILSFIIFQDSHAQLPSYLPTNGLVAWYPFNGNANDESGNNHNCLGQNVTSIEDRFGNANSAYYFNGNSYLQNTSLNITNNPGFTLSAWFKIDNLQESGGGHLCMFWSDPRGLQFYVSNAGITFRVWNYDLVFDLSTNLFPLGEWNNIIVTSNCVNESKVYLNGELRSQIASPAILPYNMSFFTIGKHGFWEPPTAAFKGSIDDIAIYARSLSSTEIQQLIGTNSGPGNEGGFGGPLLPVTPAPPSIPYQAEVRSDNGQVLANANVNVRFTLHELTANGAVSYQETHAIITNELGLFAATIGAGAATQGTFASINWAQTTKFLQVEVDTGNGYITMGNQQLMSVPYALYAANGPAGPQGPVGPQGPAGADGQQGAPGTNGQNCFTHFIGELYGGGIVFHVKRDSSGSEHGLIVYPDPISLFELFGDIDFTMMNCTSDWDGANNTACLALNQDSGIAEIISNFQGNNQTDWYIPSITEFLILHNQLFELRKSAFMSNSLDMIYRNFPVWTSTFSDFEEGVVNVAYFNGSIGPARIDAELTCTLLAIRKF